MFAKAPAWCYGVPFVGYAMLLLALGADRVAVLTSGALVANVIVYLLPWRFPRDDRTPLGYWLEALICSLPMGMCALVWLTLTPGKVSARLPAHWAPLWFGCAAFAGLFLVRLTRGNWRALVSGDLAFLAGPLQPYRAAARTWMVAVSIVSEEVIFRGLPAGLAKHSTLALIAGGLTFVAGHHLLRGDSARASWLMVRYELAGAVMFGGLVVVSGSIWPAVAAHVVANFPAVALDWQRTRTATTDSIQQDKVTT
jgi:hypothetical protein